MNNDDVTSGDYAMSAAQDNAKAIKALEHRLSILEGICSVIRVTDPFAIEDAIKRIKTERDEREKVESARQRQVATDRLPEEKRRMQEMINRHNPYSFGTLGGR